MGEAAAPAAEEAAPAAEEDADAAAKANAGLEANMTPEELEKKRKQDEFDRMDKNHDGAVNRKEWEEFVEEKKEADIDGNGVVDSQEWDEFDKKKEMEKSRAN